MIKEKQQLNYNEKSLINMHDLKISFNNLKRIYNKKLSEYQQRKLIILDNEKKICNFQKKICTLKQKQKLILNSFTKESNSRFSSDYDKLDIKLKELINCLFGFHGSPDLLLKKIFLEDFELKTFLKNIQKSVFLNNFEELHQKLNEVDMKCEIGTPFSLILEFIHHRIEINAMNDELIILNNEKEKNSEEKDRIYLYLKNIESEINSSEISLKSINNVNEKQTDKIINLNKAKNFKMRPTLEMRKLKTISNFSEIKKESMNPKKNQSSTQISDKLKLNEKMLNLSLVSNFSIEELENDIKNNKTQMLSPMSKNHYLNDTTVTNNQIYENNQNNRKSINIKVKNLITNEFAHSNDQLSTTNCIAKSISSKMNLVSVQNFYSKNKQNTNFKVKIEVNDNSKKNEKIENLSSTNNFRKKEKLNLNSKFSQYRRVLSESEKKPAKLRSTNQIITTSISGVNKDLVSLNSETRSSQKDFKKLGSENNCSAIMPNQNNDEWTTLNKIERLSSKNIRRNQGEIKNLKMDKIIMKNNGCCYAQ